MKSPLNQLRFLRLFLPLIMGSIVYGLLLMLFDRIDSIQSNFLTYELLFCVICSYIWSEVLIFPWKSMFKHENIGEEPQCIKCNLLWFILSIASVAVLVFINFYQIIGYHNLSSFVSELKAFMGIYTFLSLLYFTWLYGVYYVKNEFQLQMESEAVSKEELQDNWKKHLHTFRPHLLFNTLETIISQSYQAKQKAEKLSEVLADVYRYFWNQMKEEMVSLETELKQLEKLSFVINEIAEGQFQFEINIDDRGQMDYQVVPSSTLQVLECIHRTSIVNRWRKLKVSCYIEEEYLCFEYDTNEKLYEGNEDCKKLINDLDKTYHFWTSTHVLQMKAYGKNLLKLPLINTEL